MAENQDVGQQGFLSAFKHFFVRGLAALLPTLVTIAILIWAYELVDRHIGQYITNGLISALCAGVGPPAPGTVDLEKDALRYGTPTDELDAQGRQLTREYKIIHHPAHSQKDGKPWSSPRRTRALWKITFAKYRLGLVGFLLAISAVFFVGFFLASFIGRTTWRLIESLLVRTPVIKAIYPHVKQVTDFLFRERKADFAGVVAVQYPRKGVWALGLLTGSPLGAIQRTIRQDMVTVFIPSSPTPVTGYVVTVPREDVIELSISIDDAIRFTVSGGVVKPTSRMPVPSQLPHNGPPGRETGQLAARASGGER